MCNFYILAGIGAVIAVAIIAIIEKRGEKPFYVVNKEEEHVELKGMFGNGGEWRRGGKWK